MERTTEQEATLVATLNDLLQLDHDAVQAYSLAMRLIGSDSHRTTIERYRGDHERHIEELTRLIRAHGGIPIELPHLPTGVFKLAMQAVGAAGGDRGVLLAFKANERQGRDRYQRAARERHPEDVTVVLHRFASDEATHYAWVEQALAALDVGPSDTMRRIEEAVEVPHARMADMVEDMERGAMRAAERARRGLAASVGKHPFGALLIAVGAGVVLSQLLDRD